MNEWQDETLVAICNCTNNKFEVWELPACQRRTVGGRKPKFRTYEKAEQYIAEQYTGVLVVQPDDILQEIKIREAAFAKLLGDTGNNFAGAAREAAQIVERLPYRMYRISYRSGAFLTYWNGASEEHARDLAADYYHISSNRLVAQIEH